MLLPAVVVAAVVVTAAAAVAAAVIANLADPRAKCRTALERVQQHIDWMMSGRGAQEDIDRHHSPPVT